MVQNVDKADRYIKPVMSAWHLAVLKGATHCTLFDVRVYADMKIDNTSLLRYQVMEILLSLSFELHE